MSVVDWPINNSTKGSYHPVAEARNGSALLSGWFLLKDRRLISHNFAKNLSLIEAISQLFRKSGGNRKTTNEAILVS